MEHDPGPGARPGGRRSVGRARVAPAPARRLRAREPRRPRTPAGRYAPPILWPVRRRGRSPRWAAIPAAAGTVLRRVGSREHLAWWAEARRQPRSSPRPRRTYAATRPGRGCRSATGGPAPAAPGDRHRRNGSAGRRRRPRRRCRQHPAAGAGWTTGNSGEPRAGSLRCRHTRCCRPTPRSRPGGRHRPAVGQRARRRGPQPRRSRPAAVCRRRTCRPASCGQLVRGRPRHHRHLGCRHPSARGSGCGGRRTVRHGAAGVPPRLGRGHRLAPQAGRASRRVGLADAGGGRQWQNGSGRPERPTPPPGRWALHRRRCRWSGRLWEWHDDRDVVGNRACLREGQRRQHHGQRELAAGLGRVRHRQPAARWLPQRGAAAHRGDPRLVDRVHDGERSERLRADLQRSQGQAAVGPAGLRRPALVGQLSSTSSVEKTSCQTQNTDLETWVDSSYADVAAVSSAASQGGDHGSLAVEVEPSSAVSSS